MRSTRRALFSATRISLRARTSVTHTRSRLPWQSPPRHPRRLLRRKRRPVHRAMHQVLLPPHLRLQAQMYRTMARPLSPAHHPHRCRLCSSAHCLAFFFSNGTSRSYMHVLVYGLILIPCISCITLVYPGHFRQTYVLTVTLQTLFDNTFRTSSTRVVYNIMPVRAACSTIISTGE